MKRTGPWIILLVMFWSVAGHPALAQARMVTDEMGRRVEVPAKPSRLIGLTPSITELFFAMGLGDKIVGATTWADYPAKAKDLPRVGAYVSPNLEIIVGLGPDLVLANKEGNPSWVVYKLSKAGVPVYVITPMVPSELPASLERLGDLCGAPEAGRRLAADMRKGFAEVASRLTGVKPVKALMVIGSRPLVTVGDDTMNHRILELAGGINVAAGALGRWPRLSLESVIAAQPEVVIVSTMERGQDLARDMAYWRNMPGLKSKPGYRVVHIPSDLVDRPGPRLTQGLRALAEALHPERFAKPKGKQQ